MPHCKVAGMPSLQAVLGRSAEGVDFRAADGKPVRLFVALFAPERAGAGRGGPGRSTCRRWSG